MDSLLEQLTASGALSDPMAEWARAHQSRQGLPLDTALLELDLIDEEGLLAALEKCTGLTAARRQDIQRADPDLSGTLKEGFARSFRLCPLRLNANELVALVESPLADESLEDLRNLFGLEPRQLAACSHYLALAMAKVYGTEVLQRTRDLEEKLSRLRKAAEIQEVLAKVQRADSLGTAIAEVLDFAAGRLAFSCFMVLRDGQLRVASVRGGQASREPLAPPEMDCSLAAAMRYGGYFSGPIRKTPADKSFLQALGRPLVNYALVAPVPTAGETKVLLYADNGPRGIAGRWASDLTLLTSRLGQLSREYKESVEEVFLLQLDQLDRDPHLEEFTSTDASLAADPMEPLLKDLIAKSVLNETMVEWARDHHSEFGVPLDTALLELDLLDEEGLLQSLESCFKITAARPYDLMRADPEVCDLLPESFRQACRLVPLRRDGNELLALVGKPLPQEALERLRERHSLRPRQLVAASHYLALAEDKVFGIGLEPRTRELEARLSRRRGVQDIQSVLAGVLRATTFPSAVSDILDFASGLLEYACFMVCRQGELRLAATTERGAKPGGLLALPETDGSLGAAFRQGGYFVGPLSGNPADQRFYQALGRALPRWAFVAPLPTSGDKRVFFYADNGPRGIATRWVAELSLLIARLGLRTTERKPEAPQEIQNSPSGEAFLLEFDRQVTRRIAPAKEPTPAVESEPDPSSGERAVLERLKQAAAEAGKDLEAFVDELLAERRVSPPAADTSALVGEVRDLFQKLASDIPAQLARGMETAFKDMVPRLASSAPAQQSAQFGPRPASTGGIVRKESAAPREVQNYRQKRRKTKRVKL